MTSSEMTQMNTRIRIADKNSGDAVLAKYGITPSTAVRRLWRYLAEKRSIPPFMADCIPQESSPASASNETNAADAGAGLAARLAADAGLTAFANNPSYDELRDLAFEEWLAEKQEQGAIHV